MTLEKSTSFMRVRVMVLEPHSMSARPFATASKRDWTVTGTQSILSGWILSWRSIELTTRLHSSIEKPSTCLLLVDVRERNRVGPVGDGDRLRLRDLLEPALEGLRLNRRGGEPGNGKQQNGA